MSKFGVAFIVSWQVFWVVVILTVILTPILNAFGVVAWPLDIVIVVTLAVLPFVMIAIRMFLR
jgi:hypothetical protein